MNFVGGVGCTNLDLIYSKMDRIPAMGEEVFAGNFGMYLGGGVPATLINTTRLGISSKILTFVGEDFFSDFAKKAYFSYGAKIVNLYNGKGMPVTLSSVLVCNNERSFVSYREAVEIDERMEGEIYRHLHGAKIVDMLPSFFRVYKKLKAEGTILIFDTGWEDELTIEKYREYLMLADYYLPNRKEALKITGTQTVEDAVEKLSEFFETAIVKLDKEGCLIKNKRGLQFISSLKNVIAVDSTGAGDAFMSGFIYGLFYDYPIEQCVRFGNVTGGTCVRGVGCLTQYVNESQLLELEKTL